MAAAQDDRTANDTENADVTVSVSETIAVDIQPANLQYSNAVVGNRNTTSDRGFGAIEIENTGSTYINRIWLNNSIPTTDPFGTGTSSNYDAGNFLEVRPVDFTNGDSTDWHPINKKVYMSSSDTGSNGVTDIPSFIQTPDSWSTYEVGGINRGNETIYFAINADGTDDTCDGDASATVRVGNVSATDSRLGTVDFTSSTEYGYVEYTLSQLSGNSYGVTDDTSNGFSGTTGLALNWTYTNSDSPTEVDMLTRCAPTSEQPHTFVNKYNVNTAGADDIQSGAGSATTYLLKDTTNTGNMLAPGSMKTLETAINVPEGVAAGDVGAGVLRVLITSN